MRQLSEINDQSDRPLLCMEINPPRGADAESALAKLEGQLDGVDFLNVTDCALAKLRMAPIPFASLIKQRFGIEPLVNLTCRDRNTIAIQADLMGAWALGIRSIVALTGDAVTTGDNPNAKGVFEINSVALLKLMAAMSESRDLVGNALRGGAAFVPGVVVNPNVKNPSVELRRLQKKKDAGARYALSQPVFDVDVARNFLEEARGVGLPIFLGLLPVKTIGGAKHVSDIPGIKMADSLLARLEGGDDTDVSDFFLQFCVELAKQTAPLVAGFHVIGGATPRLGLQLVHELATVFKGL